MSGTGFDQEFTLTADATADAVRDLLARARARLIALGIGAQVCGTAELVLAEALNNIVEHAYAPGRPGPVSVTAQIGARDLHLLLRDRGRRLPGGRPPDGRCPESDVPRATIPEGGFGWFLIRDLARSVAYHRRNGENHLILRLALTPGPPMPR